MSVPPSLHAPAYQVACFIWQIMFWPLKQKYEISSASLRHWKNSWEMCQSLGRCPPHRATPRPASLPQQKPAVSIRSVHRGLCPRNALRSKPKCECGAQGSLPSTRPTHPNAWPARSVQRGSRSARSVWLPATLTVLGCPRCVQCHRRGLGTRCLWFPLAASCSSRGFPGALWGGRDPLKRLGGCHRLASGRSHSQDRLAGPSGGSSSLAGHSCRLLFHCSDSGFDGEKPGSQRPWSAYISVTLPGREHPSWPARVLVARPGCPPHARTPLALPGCWPMQMASGVPHRLQPLV